MLFISLLHMRTANRIASNFGMLAGISRLVLGLSLGLIPSCAMDDSPEQTERDIDFGDEEIGTESVCSSGAIRCLAHVQTIGSGANRRVHTRAAAPIGLGPAELQAAYKIDPTRTATPTPTIAIVDAYGYPELEADLAVYRAQYKLPPCTTANGCLKIVNQNGQTAPLPPSPPANDDWTVETALDVDAASAACPLCKILVVQADDNGAGMYIAQNTAVQLGATVISNSWGQPELAADGLAVTEPYFNHPGVAVFVASGDFGYNNLVLADATLHGPPYPGTSQYTISVGATRLERDATSARGWKESAWSTTLTNGQIDPAAGAGGSGCSLAIPKPAYQTKSPCAYKATTDISAVGDPATGFSVYNTHAPNRQWLSVGGTSASAPFVAAIFAATGNGAQTSGEFIANNAAKLNDVTTGSNGSCGANNLLCNAAAGWDGPTGFGTPDVSKLMPSASNGNGGDGTGSGDGSGDGDVGDDLTGGCSTGGGAGLGGIAFALALLLRRKR